MSFQKDFTEDQAVATYRNFNDAIGTARLSCRVFCLLEQRIMSELKVEPDWKSDELVSSLKTSTIRLASLLAMDGCERESKHLKKRMQLAGPTALSYSLYGEAISKLQAGDFFAAESIIEDVESNTIQEDGRFLMIEKKISELMLDEAIQDIEEIGDPAMRLPLLALLSSAFASVDLVKANTYLDEAIEIAKRSIRPTLEQLIKDDQESDPIYLLAPAYYACDRLQEGIDFIMVQEDQLMQDILLQSMVNALVFDDVQKWGILVSYVEKIRNSLIQTELFVRISANQRKNDERGDEMLKRAEESFAQSTHADEICEGHYDMIQQILYQHLVGRDPLTYIDVEPPTQLREMMYYAVSAELLKQGYDQEALQYAQATQSTTAYGNVIIHSISDDLAPSLKEILATVVDASDRAVLLAATLSQCIAMGIARLKIKSIQQAFFQAVAASINTLDAWQTARVFDALCSDAQTHMDLCHTWSLRIPLDMHRRIFLDGIAKKDQELLAGIFISVPFAKQDEMLKVVRGRNPFLARQISAEMNKNPFIEQSPQ
ncbi:MAG: hypothetical protein AAB400_00100 [Patescibacteria group bacterium]